MVTLSLLSCRHSDWRHKTHTYTGRKEIKEIEKHVARNMREIKRIVITRHDQDQWTKGNEVK